MVGARSNAVDKTLAMKRPALNIAVAIVLVAFGIILYNTLLDDLAKISHAAGDYGTNVERLWGEATLGQTVQPPRPNVSGIELRVFGPKGVRLEGEITLHVRRTPQETEDLRTSTVLTSAIRRGADTRFSFAPLDTRTEETLYFFLEYPKGTKERPLEVRAERFERLETQEPTNDYLGGTLHRNHVPADEDLAFRVLTRDRRPFGVQTASAAVLGGLALIAHTLLRVPMSPARAGRVGGLRWRPRATALAILGIGLPVIFFLPLLENQKFLGVGDWDMNTTLHAAAERTLVRESGFPGWNPYLCGGTPLAAFPEAPVFSPFFATVLLGGPVFGFKINILLHGVIGFLGMLLWLRRGFKVSWLAAFLGSSVVMFSSFVALHLAAGHSRKVAIAWIPWVLYFLQRAWSGDNRSIRNAAPAGLALALMFLDGSVYLSLYTAAFVMLASLFTSLSERAWRPLVAGLVTLLIGGLLAGVHILPVLASQRHLDPAFDTTKAIPARALAAIFLDASQTISAERFLPQPQPWLEYGAYVGIVPLLLVLFSIATADRRLMPWVGAGAVFLLGSFLPAMQRGITFLPILGDLRNPQRMVVMVTVVMGIAAAVGLDRLARLLLHDQHPGTPNAAVRASLGVLTVIVIGNLIFVNAETLSGTFVVPPPPGVPRGAPPAVDTPFRQGWARQRFDGVQDSFSFTMERTVRNSGSVNRCSVASVRPSGALRIPPEDRPNEVGSEFTDEPYQGEAFFLQGRGTAAVETFRTSAVAVRYVAETQSTLALNQNYHPGWSVRLRSEGNGETRVLPAFGERDLVAANVGPGAGTAVFSYTPPFLGLGLLTSAFGLGTALWIWKQKTLKAGTKLHD